MSTKPDPPNDSADAAFSAERTLRQRAEEKMKATRAENLESLSPDHARQLLHELQVHQIELEMQNDELRRVQDALEITRARYFDLYDLAPVGYMTLNAEGLILEANLRTATLLGVPRGNLVKQPLSRFISPEDQDQYYLCRKRLYTTTEPQVCGCGAMRPPMCFGCVSRRHSGRIAKPRCKSAAPP